MRPDLEAARRSLRVSDIYPIEISVIDLGPRASKRTIVFLHGLGGSALDWHAQLDFFSSACRVIAVDLRGHGRSSSSNYSSEFAEVYGDWRILERNLAYNQYYLMNEGSVGHFSSIYDELRLQPSRRRNLIRYTLTAFLSDFDQICQQLSIQAPFVLVGFSFGGIIAAEFARRNSDRVSHLILVGLQAEYALKAIYRVLHSVAKFFLYWTSKLSSQLAAQTNIWVYMLKRWQGRDTFFGLRLPVLLVHAAPERIFETASSANFAKAIPRCAQAKLKGGRSARWLGHARELNYLIQDFLLTHP
jgi:pimeloyl-ACP methyl ester carboxylesterase